MRTYKYKNIICFESFGRWYADYRGERRFALHRASLGTKADCYALAKECVDYLNYRKEKTSCV